MAHPRRRRQGGLWPAGANTPSALDWHPEARSGSSGDGTIWQAAQGCHRGSHTHTFTARAQPELSRVPRGTLHFTPSDAPSVPLGAPGGCGILLRCLATARVQFSPRKRRTDSNRRAPDTVPGQHSSQVLRKAAEGGPAPGCRGRVSNAILLLQGRQGH